ncbi:MAG: DUF4215 domain-containing protein [Deltaproteobacteria bacterium]|nr:DUF4215 domain-containing protein [Deltaproteobacteria bacterium]
MLLNTGIRIGATIKLFKKPRDFLIWAWSKAWDLGSRQKLKFQPGLESSYLTECSSSIGNVTNHQPGAAAGITCSGGDNKVCRYPDASNASWSSYDQPHELLAVCKGEMPNDAQDPLPPTPEAFGDSMTDLTSFGLDVGESQWNAHQLCVGPKGQPLTEWLQNPSDQVNGTCKYKGKTPGAPASFPCKDLERYSMEIWGCLNTNSGLGLTVKNIITTKVSATASTYLVTPSYASSLTSTPVLDLHALVPDPWATPATAVFAPAVWSTLTPIEQLQLRQWLQGVEQCYDAHFQSESACGCTTSAGCDTAAGQTCSGGSCLTSQGTVATCPFLEFGTPADVHPCCGDGVVTASVFEQCDDGNTVSGDGCNLECKSERAGAACCTQTGCVDVTGTSAVAECNKKGGSAFSGKTCKELDFCGHEPKGACIGPDKVCHEPTTEKQCAAIKGAWSMASCPK